jgi:folate-binding protein YgfZ
VLRHEVGAVVVARDVIEAQGPDTFTFLQGQLSQDLESLAVGDSAWSLVLQPQGRVDALARVTRTDEEALILDVDGGHGEALLARLSRFKLRVRCDLVPLDWRTVALRGPGAGDVDVAAHAPPVIAPARWPGVEGVDLIGPDVEAPAGVPTADLAAYEALRIEAGWPAMGAELDERTIPAEAGIVEASVSFTKGCFTGQELVARIDSRGGNVPRRLRGLVFAGGELPPVGAEVRRDEDRDDDGDGAKPVGHLTSVARSGELGGPIALAYLGRGVEVPAEVTVSWDGGSAPAQARTLPLVG